MKIIPKISPQQQLDHTLPAEIENVHFAILDDRNNFHNTQEMAEIYSAAHGNDKTKPVVDLVAFKPERLLEHHLVSELVTSVKLENLEKDFQDKFTSLKESINIEDFVQAGSALRAANIQKMRSISQDIDSIDDPEAKKIYLATKINKDYVPGKFIEGVSAEDMRIMIAADKLTNQQLNIMAGEEASKAVKQQIEAGKLEALTEHDASDRVTLSVNGAIASGKGSSEMILHDYATNTLKLPWNDFSKINGDSIKFVLNSQDGMSNKIKEVFSQLAQDEVTLIANAINVKLKEKLVKTGKAPNVFLDKSLIPQDGADIANYNGGQLKGIVVSLDAQEAINRSMTRGEKIGRFEDTKGILDAHASIPEKFTKLITDNSTRDISYTVYDNNVPFGVQPIKAATVDFASKTWKVHDKEKFKRFLDKADLDVKESLATAEVKYKPEHLNRQVDPNEIKFIAEMFKAGFSTNTGFSKSAIKANTTPNVQSNSKEVKTH